MNTDCHMQIDLNSKLWFHTVLRFSCSVSVVRHQLAAPKIYNSASRNSIHRNGLNHLFIYYINIEP